MTAPHADQLIEGYLARISAAAADFPGAARNELLDDMRAHIAEARSREPEETDAAILNILDRLGEPSVVVAEARERLGLRGTPLTRPGLLEIAAVVLVPIFWIVGVVLLWWSPAWGVRDKVIGTVCSLGGYPTVLIFGILAAHQSAGIASQSTDPAIFSAAGRVLEAAVPLIIFLMPALTAIYLVVSLRWGRHAHSASV